MTIEEARQRIQTTIEQFEAQAGVPLDLLMSDVRASLGDATANDLIAEFDLELRYNIVPTHDPGTGDS
ncbi:hypothetical protein [Nitrospira sp. Kam-Ns4a]